MGVQYPICAYGPNCLLNLIKMVYTYLKKYLFALKMILPVYIEEYENIGPTTY